MSLPSLEENYFFAPLFDSPSSYSEKTLLALLIGGPKAEEIAENVLKYFQNNIYLLSKAEAWELVNIEGIGKLTAVRLKSAFELATRISNSRSDSLKTIRGSQDAFDLCADMKSFQQEHFRVISLSTKNQVIHSSDLYIGTLNSAQIRTGEVFKAPIIRHAAAIIIAHNHPSGDALPSPEDIAVTRSVVQAGKLLDIDVLDHVIIGHERSVSLKEKGLGFNG